MPMVLMSQSYIEGWWRMHVYYTVYYVYLVGRLRAFPQGFESLCPLRYLLFSYELQFATDPVHVFQSSHPGSPAWQEARRVLAA